MATRKSDVNENDLIILKINELAYKLMEAEGITTRMKGTIQRILLDHPNSQIRRFFDIASIAHEYYTGDEVADAASDYRERRPLLRSKETNSGA